MIKTMQELEKYCAAHNKCAVFHFGRYCGLIKNEGDEKKWQQ